MRERCEKCPLNNYSLEDVPCVGQFKNPRYCSLKDSREEQIVNSSVSIYNERVQKEGIPKISWKSIKRFGKAIKNWAAASFEMTTDDVRNERLSLCNQCENLTNTRQCSLCTCFVDEKIKYASEECPMRKWLKNNSSSNGCGCGK